jgi:hypothetical protein
MSILAYDNVFLSILQQLPRLDRQRLALRAMLSIDTLRLARSIELT